jgi:hypothetical protein
LLGQRYNEDCLYCFQSCTEGYVMTELMLKLFASCVEYSDKLRLSDYRDTNTVLLCFDIGYPDSLENISEKWFPEIKRYCPAGTCIVNVCLSISQYSMCFFNSTNYFGWE